MALRKRSSKGYSCSNRTAWMLAMASVAALALLGRGESATSSSSCPPCDLADGILLNCNSTLDIQDWPGTYVYQPSAAQAQCACNENYYTQMVSCLSCQSSTTAHFSVTPLANYQLICQSLGQTAFPAVYMPPTTTTSSAPTDTALPSSGSGSGASGGHSSSISSGAIAGIAVAAVALIVALSVAGYVFARRRRQLAKQQQEDDDLYKYQEATRNSYMETPLPQYTGMIQSSSPSLSRVTNLRVMNPDNDDEDENHAGVPKFAASSSFDAPQSASSSSPGWRRGSFDDD